MIQKMVTSQIEESIIVIFVKLSLIISCDNIGVI